MPYPAQLGKLVKSDRRKEWRALKSTHSKAIAASKVNFDAKLGPRLDDYQTAVDAVAKAFAKDSVNRVGIQKVVKVAGPVRNVAESYLEQVKTKVPEPARKELTAFLEAVMRDSADWLTVDDLFDQHATRPSAQALARVRPVVAELDRLSTEMTNLEVNLPHFSSALKDLAKNANYTWYVDSSTKVTPPFVAVPEAQFRSSLAGKCRKLAETAGKLGTANKRLLPHVDALCAAGHESDASVNVGALVDRLKKLVLSPELKTLHDSATALAAMMASPDFHAGALGFWNGKGPPESANGRRPAGLNRGGISAAGVMDRTIDVLSSARSNLS
jgi:hypothetical protein